MAEKLKVISLGGLNEIGKNITVLEYGNDMIVVDCGLGFPEDDMYGIDLVIPDFSYLVQNQNKIRGIFLTHGHEDHIGSLPYLLHQLNAPVHATRLTLGLCKLKLEEHGLLEQAQLFTHEAGETVKAGCFKVEFIHVNHSIADAVSFAIRTPVGLVVMTGDFKIDPTPLEGGMIDLGRFGELGKEGVLAMFGESTNVERQGYTTSERVVAASFDRLFKDCDQRIIVTTFASNAHRLQSILTTAHKYGRKVAVTGRSMENILQVSTELGYLQVPPNTLVDLNAIKSLPKEKVVVVSTGSQGENMSALYRMAFTGHKQVEIQAGDRIIISASAIPGNEKSVSRIIDELYRKGAEVVYGTLSGLHVSGHACQEELKIMHGLLKPKFFVPIHGEQRHLKQHAKLAQEMGMEPKNIVISDVGRIIEITPRSIKLGGTVPAGKVLVDGMGVGDVGSVVMRDRKHLAEDGMIVVVANLSVQDRSVLSGPDIITRGFVYVKESENLMEELRIVAAQALDHCLSHGITEWSTIKATIKGDLSGYLYKKTKRNPMILPVITEL
ncbi:MAG: ribonuclease J [Oscillospiraceae bacterium]|nr:ribonuclease J [Oscillospiraceae bacterium]